MLHDDVIGDAVLVIWPPNDTDDLTVSVRRAGQCGLEISRQLQGAELADGVTLNIKIGIGCGVVNILHLGGVYGRTEYVLIGMHTLANHMLISFMFAHKC
jgi:adenylate cyclase 10